MMVIPKLQMRVPVNILAQVLYFLAKVSYFLAKVSFNYITQCVLQSVC